MSLRELTFEKLMLVAGGKGEGNGGGSGTAADGGYGFGPGPENGREALGL